MQKIKKFKISLRPASVRKNFKTLAGPERLTPEAEELISHEYERSPEWLTPAASFETFRVDALPSFLSPLSESTTPAAVSLLVATIGTQVEEEIRRSGEPDDLRALVLSALAEEGAEVAAGFVVRLLAEEAKKEDCELGEREDLSDDKKDAALTHLSADRIGVRLENQAFSPRFTRLSSILWIPRMTKKRRLLMSPGKAPLADQSA